MKFTIRAENETIITLARKIGYRPIGVENDQYSIVKTLMLGRDYPRLHIYIRKIGESEFEINLHLDQKKPSYEGSTAHSGEYEGELVEKEAERIKQLLKQSK